MEHARILIEQGYVTSSEDPFVNFSYDRLRGLFDDPGQEILIVAETPDFICRACPKKGACFDSNGLPIPVKRKLGNAFAKEEDEEIERISDYGIARGYGLKVGGVYTAQEIRRIVGF